MLTWARYLLIVSLTAVLVTGPVVSAPSLPRSCEHQQADADGLRVTKSCTSADHACSGGEMSCCRRSHSEPVFAGDDAGCGSCPLSGCTCCQTSQGLVQVCVLPNRSACEPRVPAVRLIESDAVLNSRSDEPVVPPPIA